MSLIFKKLLLLKRIFKLISYNLLVIIFLLLILEFTIRLIHPEIKSQGTDKNLIIENAYSYSPGLKPNSEGISNGAELKTNQFGFRECSIPFDTSKSSWLLIGDSVTMGLGVESDSTFPAIIQMKENNINILNASMFGYSLQDYMNEFYHFIQLKNKLKIKKLSILWSLNDIYLGKINQYEMPGGGIRYLFNNILTWFRWNSRFYTFLKSEFSDRPKLYFEYDNSFYTERNPLFQKSIDSLKLISSICKNEGIDFNIIILPYEFQLRKNISEAQPQKLLKEYLDKDSIKVLDPLPYLRLKNIQSNKLYLFGDGIHFSDSGHRLIAEFILKTND